MRGNLNTLAIIGILMVISGTCFSGVNPFKKSKNYTFGPDVAWYENNDTAIKSGSIRDGSDTNYYHLNIDKHRLLLRLGKNDPSGELENTRLLDSLSITEVLIDGQRLPLFDWCLQNQQNPGKKIKQNAIVANDVCINAGGGGDIVFNLDDETRDYLKHAESLEFIVEPYGRPLKLVFSMSGYAPIMAKINKPIPPPVVKKPVPPPVAVVKPIPKPKPKPKEKPKPKSKPKPKPVEKCYANAPASFKSTVPTISYPCDNAAKKSQAEKKISAGVAREKKKIAARLQADKNKKLAKERKVVDEKRDAEWDKKQAALWVSRCKRHWAKNRSPCYCEKYLYQAPAGVKSTCEK